MLSETKKMTWDKDVKILTSPVMMRQIYIALGIPFFLVFLFVTVLMLIDGVDSFSQYLLNIYPFIYIVIGLLLLPILIIFIFFNNIYPYTFILNEKMAIMSTRKEHRRKNNKAANLLILLGILTGRPGASVTGIMSKNNYDRAIRYRDIKEIIVYHKSQTILLKGSNPLDKCYLMYEEDRLTEIIEIIQSKLKNRLVIKSK